ncbi:MAG: hypothetical protein JEZ06_11605 [Anaerolineaceae bacterium]|nr:hypothetical protein [Anaerolineaceae bacterium]
MMSDLGILDFLFIVWAFFFQIVLIIHFAVRKRWFESYTMKYGWWVYALCIPAVLISLILLLGGKSWSFWLGGFLFLVYAVFGYWIDFIKGIEWRSPLNKSILFPYVTLYLATVMFYWWPLALLDRRLWFVYAGLFVISTFLNLRSH